MLFKNGLRALCCEKAAAMVAKNVTDFLDPLSAPNSFPKMEILELKKCRYQLMVRMSFGNVEFV